MESGSASLSKAAIVGAPIEICKARAPMMRALSKRVYANGEVSGATKVRTAKKVSAATAHRKWCRTTMRYTKIRAGMTAVIGDAMLPTIERTITMTASHQAQPRR